MIARKLIAATVAQAALCAVAHGQIPDLMTTFDPGGRAMGLGGSTYSTDASTFSASFNPAGLGYLRQAVFGVSFRNLPGSRNLVTGDFDDPDFNTDYRAGSFGLGHVGYAFPVGQGVLGISYTLAGFVRDERFGDGLTLGALTVRNYTETLLSQTDLFTFSYGYGSADGTANYGFGLVVANQYVRNLQDYELFNGGTPAGTVTASNSGNGLGFGLVAGLLLTPSSSPNTSYGISAQTPIDLSGNSETVQYYDRVPGRVSFGAATRSDGDRGTYVLYGVQASWYYGGQGNKILARDSYFAFGGGIEYGLRKWGGRVPVRFGYALVPAGGTGFIDRNAMTFGLGYRPDHGDYSLDLSLAKPVDGSDFDMSVSITYFVGKK